MKINAQHRSSIINKKFILTFNLLQASIIECTLTFPCSRKHFESDIKEAM